jgi:hypothetical protein
LLTSGMIVGGLKYGNLSNPSFVDCRAITHDSDMYPNPWVFDPERFVPRPGVEPQTDPRKWVFGFGRRVSAQSHAKFRRIYFEHTPLVRLALVSFSVICILNATSIILTLMLAIMCRFPFRRNQHVPQHYCYSRYVKHL